MPTTIETNNLEKNLEKMVINRRNVKILTKLNTWNFKNLFYDFKLTVFLLKIDFIFQRDSDQDILMNKK